MSDAGSSSGSVGIGRRRDVELQSLIGARPRVTRKCLLAYDPPIGDVFKALANRTRRAILDELTERNDQTLFELCSRLAANHRVATSRQAVSQHLDVLVAAGLVETRREGRYKFHHLNPRPLERITDRWLQRRPEDT